jgi:hypothetical protein
MGKGRDVHVLVYTVLVRKPEGKRPFGRPRRKWGILRWIFRKWDRGHGLDRAGSGKEQVAGTCECENEPSGSIKCGGIS